MEKKECYFGGSKSAKGGSKSASGYGPGESKSASGFGPGGPNPRGVQIRCDTGSHSKKVNRVLFVRRYRRRFSSSWFRLSYEPRSCREYKIPLTARLGVLSGSIPVEFFTGRHNKPSKFCELGACSCPIGGFLSVLILAYSPLPRTTCTGSVAFASSSWM